MRNLDLNNYGVLEMNAEEMRVVEGGFIPLVIIAVAVVMSSCIIGDNNKININTEVSADSTANGNSVGAGSGNKINK
jgi:lactobin A/cerein 7B family class IIb bacteriocin